MKTSGTFLVGVLMLASHTAFSHTQLSTSMPADQAVLAAAPDEVTLHFSEAVTLIGLSIEKQGGTAQHLESSPADTSTDFAATTPDLGMGAYVVRWRAVGADTHVITGEFGFTISAEGAAHHSEMHPEVPADARSDSHAEAHAGTH